MVQSNALISRFLDYISTRGYSLSIHNITIYQYSLSRIYMGKVSMDIFSISIIFYNYAEYSIIILSLSCVFVKIILSIEYHYLDIHSLFIVQHFIHP